MRKTIPNSTFPVVADNVILKGKIESNDPYFDKLNYVAKGKYIAGCE